MPEELLEPIPGESRLALVVCVVGLGLSATAFVATLVASFFVDDLGPTVMGAGVLTLVALVAVAVLWVQRRAYLRDRRLGNVQERVRWTGDNGTAPM